MAGVIQGLFRAIDLVCAMPTINTLVNRVLDLDVATGSIAVFAQRGVEQILRTDRYHGTVGPRFDIQFAGDCRSPRIGGPGSIRLGGPWQISYLGEGDGDGDDFHVQIVRLSGVEKIWLVSPFGRQVDDEGSWRLDFVLDQNCDCTPADVELRKVSDNEYVITVKNDQPGDAVELKLYRVP